MSAESTLSFTFAGHIPTTVNRRQQIFTFRKCQRALSLTPSTFISGSTVRREQAPLHINHPNIFPASYLFCMSVDKTKSEDPSTSPSKPHQSHLGQKQNGPPYKKKRFDWFKQWYPVALVADLLRSKPNAFRILDIDVVVWQSPSTPDSWTVFHDRCPHRFAALSEGVGTTTPLNSAVVFPS